MKFIDAHTHLHDSRIIRDVPGILDRARAANLAFMVTCTTMEENFAVTLDLARRHPDLLPCFGIHPWFLDTLSPDWENNLGTWLDGHPSGVGETGLDFMDRKGDRDLQIRVFKAHLALARDLGRPVNIHIRKAWDVFIHILKRMGPLSAGGLVHSYSGSADLVRVLERFNLCLSFSGAVTRPSAKKVVTAVKTVSLDRILFETDAPDLYPTLGNAGQNRDKPLLNEPALVPAIVRIAAHRRGMGFEKLAESGYANGLRLFEPMMMKGLSYKE